VAVAVAVAVVVAHLAWPLRQQVAEGIHDTTIVGSQILGRRRRTAGVARQKSNVNMPTSSATRSDKRKSVRLKKENEKRRDAAVLKRSRNDRGDRGSGSERKRNGGVLR
jgi:hypothetical protein